MANNALLFNSALEGFITGAIAGGAQSDPVSADYAGLVNQGVVFATAMDAAIPTDTAGAPQPAGTPGISIAGGAAIQPAGSSAVVEAQNFKTNLMQGLAYSAAFQRFSTTQTAAQLTTTVNALKALYLQAAASGVYT